MSGVTSTDRGGEAVLIMPSLAMATTNDLFIKNIGVVSTAEAAGYWTAIDLSHTSLGWESDKLAAAANTTEQTVIDVSGNGVLTLVVAPELSGSGTMTIRVTADGVVSTFVSETIGTGQRFLIGHFKDWGVPGTGIGDSSDTGYSNTQTNSITTTPPQAINEASIGIKFQTSLKVTIQGSVNISGTALLLNAFAGHLLSLPEGL